MVIISINTVFALINTNKSTDTCDDCIVYYMYTVSVKCHLGCMLAHCL